MLKAIQPVLRQLRRLSPPQAVETESRRADNLPPFSLDALIDPPQDAAARSLMELLDSLFNPDLPRPPGQPPPPPIAQPIITLAEIKEEPVGLGGRRGVEKRGLISLAELKGLRLNSLVRLQGRFPTPETAEQWLNDLTLVLLNSRDKLRAGGVLRIQLDSAPAAEFVNSPDGDSWRAAARFRLLYEYHYQDSGGAQSLIARIPVGCHLEEGVLQATTVTDEMVRWDEDEAPPLQLSGAGIRQVGGLSVLVHPPGGQVGGQVTVARLDLSSAAEPSTATSLMDFVRRVTDPASPAANIQFSDSLEQFLQAEPFFPARERQPADEGQAAPEIRIELGDQDEDGAADEYGLRLLPFAAPLKLSGPQQVFRLDAEAGPGAGSVLYIRASRGVLSAPIESDSQ